MTKKFYIPVDNFTQLKSDSEHQFFVAVAPVDTFPTDISLSPNVREPNKRTTTFKEIVDTLIVAPDKFLSRNNGIKIAAERVTPHKDKKGDLGLWIECLEPSEDFRGHGIYDGGHTLAAFTSAKILGADLKPARVKLEIVCGASQQDVALNALAANTVSSVDRRSKINAKGGFEFIRHYLEELEVREGKHYKVAYYQNQTGVPKDNRCSVLHLCKIILCLDRVKYNFARPGMSQHPWSLTTPNLNNPDAVERMHSLLPLFPQGFWIEKQVYNLLSEYLNHPSVKGSCNLASISINSNSLLLDGTAYGFRAPEILALPIVSAFRVFLDDKYEWILPFDSFATQVTQKLWIFVRNELKKEKGRGNNGITTVYRQPGFWGDLCMIALTERDEILATYRETPLAQKLAVY
jgi:AIPR protein